MSLEHALLDRLEKRSLQIAQQKNEIYGLRQLVNEKMAINEQLAEQITTARLEREQMQHQIAELRTERDRILEASRSLVPKSALKQAVLEAAELHGALNDAQGEIQKLRAEVPLDSARDVLMNAVAKLQEETSRAHKNQVRADALDSIREFAESCGMMSDETVKAFIQRKCVELEEVRIDFKEEESRCETAVAQLQAALERITKERDLLLDASKSRDVHTKDAVDIAHAYGQKPYESLGGFIGRVCMEREELKAEQLRLNAKVGPLEKLYEVVKNHVDHGAIIDNRADIYDAVAETAKALSQLTA